MLKSIFVEYVIDFVIRFHYTNMRFFVKQKLIETLG